MAVDPGIVAITGVLASVASHFLTKSTQFETGQQPRAEWIAWGLLALGARLWLRRPPSKPLSLVDEECLEKHSESSAARWSSEKRTWLVATILVGTQLVAQNLGSTCQWVLVSNDIWVRGMNADHHKPIAPVLAALIKAMLSNRTTGRHNGSWCTRLGQQFETRTMKAAFFFPCWTTFCIFLLIQMYLDDAFDGGKVLTAIALITSTAYAVVQVEMLARQGTEQSDTHHDRHHLELLASLATKAFIICTVHAAVSSLGQSSFHMLTVGFATLRVLELGAVLTLVSMLSSPNLNTNDDSASVIHLC